MAHSRAAARGRRARYSRRCSSDHRSVRRPPLSFCNCMFNDQVCLIVSHIRAIQLTQNKRNSPHAFTTPDFVAQICVRRRTNRFNCSRNTKGVISRLVGGLEMMAPRRSHRSLSSKSRWECGLGQARSQSPLSPPPPRAAASAPLAEESLDADDWEVLALYRALRAVHSCRLTLFQDLQDAVGNGDR